MQRKNGVQGGALLGVTIVVTLLAAMATSLYVLTVAHSRATHTSDQGQEAYYIAQAGLAEAIKDVRQGGRGEVSGSFGKGLYKVVNVTNPFAVVITLIAVGREQGGIRRAIKVDLDKSPTSGRTADAALAFYGPFDKWNTTFEGGNAGMFDGNDAAGGDPRPGVAIQDGPTYQNLAQDVVAEMVAGTLSPDFAVGSPTVNLNGPNNTEWPSSFVSLSGEEPPAYPQLPTKFKSLLENLLPRVDRFVDKNFNFNADQFWGNQTGPEITVVKNPLIDNVNFNGAGTLVIQRRMTIREGRSLNWNGTIIVDGGELLNYGSLNLNGTLVATSGGKYRSEGATTDITGAMIVTSDASPSTAELIDGRVDIKGLVLADGSSNLIVRQRSPGDLTTIKGGISITSAADSRGTVKFKDKVHVQYNSNYLQNALREAARFLEENGVAPEWGVTSWLEVPPPGGVLDTP